MSKNKVEKVRTVEDIKSDFEKSRTGYDAKFVLAKADKEKTKDVKEFTSEDMYYKAMTLFEFDKGILLLNSIPELHRVFALEFNKNLQSEYNCTTPSEKSLAEVAALNFVRILSIQQKINGYLEMKTINQNGVGYLNVMSKELDRAQSHYLSSLQALRGLRSPSFSVNIKANNAMIANNQAVQVKDY